MCMDALTRMMRTLGPHYRGCNCRHCRTHGEARRQQRRAARRALKQALRIAVPAGLLLHAPPL